jgi:hypothetical protein
LFLHHEIFLLHRDRFTRQGEKTYGLRHSLKKPLSFKWAHLQDEIESLVKKLLDNLIDKPQQKGGI